MYNTRMMQTPRNSTRNMTPAMSASTGRNGSTPMPEDEGQVPMWPMTPPLVDSAPDSGDNGQTPMWPMTPPLVDSAPDSGDDGQTPMWPMTPPLVDSAPDSGDDGQTPMWPMTPPLADSTTNTDNNVQNTTLMPGYYGVRFLFAAVDMAPVNIVFGDTPIVNGLSFGQITAYATETEGTNTVTIRSAEYPNTVLNQSAFRFQQGKLYTIALLTSASGPALYQIEDTTCKKDTEQSCLRMVNLGYDLPLVDLRLLNGRTLYPNVPYAAITNYLRFLPSAYTFVAVDRAACPMPLSATATNMPAKTKNTASASMSVKQPATRSIQIQPEYTTAVPPIMTNNTGECAGTALISRTFTLAANMTYTLYLIGSAYDSPTLQFLLIENN